MQKYETVAIDCVITEHADKVKQSMEHATRVSTSTTQVGYSRSKRLNDGEIVVIRAGRLK